MNKLDIFTDYKEIECFFTKKHEVSAKLLPKLVLEGNADIIVKAGLVHGNRIQVVNEEFLERGCSFIDKNEAEAYILVPETDGLVTNLSGVALCTTHGDCIPVYAYDPILKVIGVAHAGWKGTMLGIAGSLADTMIKEYGCSCDNISAYIGPGIDKCCFEVKDDVRYAFLENVPWTKEFITQKDEEHFLIDLKGINRRFLELSGVKQISTSPDCTACKTDEYWSFRAKGDKERMLAYIAIK